MYIIYLLYYSKFFCFFKLRIYLFSIFIFRKSNINKIYQNLFSFYFLKKLLLFNNKLLYKICVCETLSDTEKILEIKEEKYNVKRNIESF